MAIHLDSSVVPVVKEKEIFCHLCSFIIMEAFSKMWSATVSGGLIPGFSVGLRDSGVLNISHILFAEDTLIFCGAIPNHLHYLCTLFLCFETVSGLKINPAKSELVLVANVNIVDGFVGILGCRVSSLPLKYLGFMWGASFKAKSIWDGIIEKVGINWGLYG